MNPDKRPNNAIIERFAVSNIVAITIVAMTAKKKKIIEDTYKKLRKVPSFMNMKCEKINGITTAYRTEAYSNEDKYSELSKVIKKLYDDYRSPFTHEGKFLKFHVKIDTIIGGISNPESISLYCLSNRYREY